MYPAACVFTSLFLLRLISSYLADPSTPPPRLRSLRASLECLMSLHMLYPRHLWSRGSRERIGGGTTQLHLDHDRGRFRCWLWLRRRSRWLNRNCLGGHRLNWCRCWLLSRRHWHNCFNRQHGRRRLLWHRDWRWNGCFAWQRPQRRLRGRAGCRRWLNWCRCGFRRLTWRHNRYHNRQCWDRDWQRRNRDWQHRRTSWRNTALLRWRRLWRRRHYGSNVGRSG